MKNIYILGSGGFAREVYFLIKEINKVKIQYKFCGFIDIITQSEILIGSERFPVIREDDFLFSNPKDVSLAMGVGDSKLIEGIYFKFQIGYNFPNLVSPSAKGDWESIQMDSGNIITMGCIFTVNITIGSFNIFNLNSTIGHDVRIGSFNVISPGVNLSGSVSLGNGNFIGTNATILQLLKIENNVVIGAGTLVQKNVDSNLILVGNPASNIIQYGKLRNFIKKL